MKAKRGNKNIAEVGKKTWFKKGDPRINRKGQPPKLPDLNIILAKLMGQEVNGSTATEKIIAALRKKAYYGDNRAAELLLDRSFGKLQNKVDVTSGGEKLTAPEFKVYNNAPPLASDEKQIENKKTK
jgi:hypothetical protein